AAGAYCDVTITLIAQWTTGHGAVVLVRNTSAVPVRWSRLELRFPGPVFSAQVWSGSVTQAGSTATIVPWPGGVLQPGQTATVGIFYAAGSGTTPAKYEVVCAPA
ncbi:MAG TPA: cellulose binding domain-containing protein, partial [Pilimelia sp.]|nr:cellulose binding domain-containing protein [Pilimelia sp.]